MKPVRAVVALMVAALISAAPSLAIGQTKDTSSPATAQTKLSARTSTNTQEIALAESAGPAAITGKATIISCGGARCADMSGMSKGPSKQLRAGTNGWVCYAFRDEPMCLDKEWQKWMEAWMSKSELRINGTGIAYMLRGDKGGSNTDPYATAPTADNQWVVAPPHIMVLFSDPKMLDAYPTDPKNGGPWIMWKGTPYGHVMVPVSPSKAATMSPK